MVRVPKAKLHDHLKHFSHYYIHNINGWIWNMEYGCGYVQILVRNIYTNNLMFTKDIVCCSLYTYYVYIWGCLNNSLNVSLCILMSINVRIHNISTDFQPVWCLHAIYNFHVIDIISVPFNFEIIYCLLSLCYITSAHIVNVYNVNKMKMKKKLLK